MRRIAERAEVRVVRRDNEYFPSCADQPVELLHRSDHVGNVLDHVHSLQRVEAGIAEGIGKAVKLDENIGARGWVTVDTDRSRPLIYAATNVQNAQPTILAR